MSDVEAFRRNIAHCTIPGAGRPSVIKGALKEMRVNPMQYQITVQGNIDPSWSDWFNGMEVSLEPGRDASCVTTFTGSVGDQATLRGILNHLWDLNLTILSVIQIEPQSDQV